MHPGLKPFVIFLSIYYGLWSPPVISAQFDKVHLLLISNGHYIDRSLNDDQGGDDQDEGDQRDAEAIRDFSGAHVSAMVVNALFDKHFGLASSTWLRSDGRRIISRDDVFNVLDTLKQKIGTPAQNEYLIVYYVGHGFGEGIAWNYFLQPGNVEFPRSLNTFDVEALAQQMIYVGDLNDTLRDLGLPYTFLIDACYEGDAVDFVSAPLLTDTAKQNLNDVSAILKFMNQFRGNNPVVFSVQPGGTVSTVAHPLDSSLPYNIGPLARRLVLGAQQWPSNRAVTLENIIRSLQSPLLDSHTQAAVSFATFEPNYSFPKAQSNSRVIVDKFWGSASTTDLHLLKETLLYDDSTTQDPGEKIDIAFATIAILGKAGEYISDGKDYIFTTGIEQINIDTLTDNELVLQMESSDDSWSFSFAAPEGNRFEAKHYKEVSRYPFQEGTQAGLDISGAGRGCNEISGDVKIDSISYMNGIPSALSLSFSQLCDDEQHPIRGSVILDVNTANVPSD